MEDSNAAARRNELLRPAAIGTAAGALRLAVAALSLFMAAHLLRRARAA